MARFSRFSRLPLTLPVLALAAALAAPGAWAHTHGEAQIDVVLEDTQLSLYLHSPLEVFLGFERAPRTAAEKNAVQQLKERLPQGEALFTPNAEAGCRFLGMEVDAPILDGQPVQNGHAELSARYRWQCAQPEHLKSVGTTLFADYKRLHKIKAVFAGPRGQHGATLGRKTPTFRW